MTEAPAQVARAVARHFRLGEVAMGSSRLAELVDGLQGLVGEGLAREAAEGLLSLLEMIVDAQARGDYLLVADLLEYEAIKILELGPATARP